MATTQTAPGLPGAFGIYQLNKDLISQGFLDGKGALSVGISNETNPVAVHKITSNEALGNDEFIVDKISGQGSANADQITFLNGNGSVGFKASGNIYAELAVFPDPASKSFTDALGPIGDTGFSVAPDPAQTLVLLRWGADAKVSGSGTVALAAGGSLDFSAQANGELFFGVVQQTPRITPTDTALAAVVANWRLPVQVHTAKDLDARTHVLSELGGKVKASVSATFGHDFNWVRQTSIGNLTGDIGLKLQLGLQATIGVSLEGKFAIVVSRESDAETLRVRLYKLRMNEFDFAFSASAAATPQTPLPAGTDYHDLVAAALGVHALQILQDLEDPNAIPKMIESFGSEYVTKLLKDFTGFDLDKARQTITDFIARWQALPHGAASLFAKMAAKDVPDYSQILQVATIVRDGDTASLKQLLDATINDLNVPFLSTPGAQFLEGIAENNALTLLDEIPDPVKQAAGKTVDFLTGAPIEKLLNSIQTTVNQRLGIDQILKLTNGDFTAGLDQLLVSKLTDFLGKVPAFQDILALQKSIDDLLTKVGNLYAKAAKALSDTYTAQLNATYQKTTTDVALIDALFDFSGANAESAKGAMAQLLSGDLADFLIHPQAGVKLNHGTLTHTVSRHAHVDLTLPFLKIESDWVNKATSSFNAIDGQNGRLSLFHLDATDQTTKKNTLTSLWKGRNWRSTTLSLTAQLSELIPTGGIAVHVDSGADAQKFATAVTSVNIEVENMSLDELIRNVEPFAVQFMPAAFTDNAAFERWTATGKLLTNPGNTLVNMNITLPPQAPLAWLNNTIADGKDPVYMGMSRLIQLALKRNLSRYFFRSLDRFGPPTMPASVVLLYNAIPPQNAIQIPGLPSGPPDIYWDPLRTEEFDAMAALGRSTLPVLMQGARDRLLAGGRTKPANDFDPKTQLGPRFAEATTGNGRSLLTGLLQAERIVVETARDAAVEIAQSKQAMATNPQKALTLLADAGAKLTEAFNKDLSNLFVQDIDALQRLSPLIFSIAAKAFDPSVPLVQNNSTLNVTVLNAGVPMPDTFPDFSADDKDILVSINAASFA